MKLEYIIIFKEEGIPIYSQCFGSFCATVGFDESLYSGFLSALTTMPAMFGGGEIQSVDMGFTKLNFSRTTPSGHIICAGIIKSTQEEEDVENQLEVFYERINDILEDEFADQNWVETKNDDIERFRQLLLHEAIYPSFPYFYDNEICTSDCPFDHTQLDRDPDTNQPLSIVEKFRKNYSKKLPWLKRLFAPIYFPLYRWFDLRKYRKKREQELKKK